jgi:hypothetical protein
MKPASQSDIKTYTLIMRLEKWPTSKRQQGWLVLHNNMLFAELVTSRLTMCCVLLNATQIIE